MLLQSYLQIAAYFLRIVEYESATRMIEGKLKQHIGHFLEAVETGTEPDT